MGLIEHLIREISQYYDLVSKCNSELKTCSVEAGEWNTKLITYYNEKITKLNGVLNKVESGF